MQERVCGLKQETDQPGEGGIIKLEKIILTQTNLKTYQM